MGAPTEASHKHEFRGQSSEHLKSTIVVAYTFGPHVEGLSESKFLSKGPVGIMSSIGVGRVQIKKYNVPM